VTEEYIRFFIGLEDIEDIKKHIGQAIATAWRFLGSCGPNKGLFGVTIDPVQTYWPKE